MPELILGPSHAFSIEGPFLRQHPHDEIVARYVHGTWHVQDAYEQDVAAYSLACQGLICLQFEDRQGRSSPRYGPFSKVEFRGDSVFVDERCLAEFQQARQHWMPGESGVRWPILNLLWARR